MFSTLGAVVSLAVVAVAAPLAADDPVPAAGESVVFTSVVRHALPHESYVRVVVLELSSRPYSYDSLLGQNSCDAHRPLLFFVRACTQSVRFSVCLCRAAILCAL